MGEADLTRICSTAVTIAPSAQPNQTRLPPWLNLDLFPLPFLVLFFEGRIPDVKDGNACKAPLARPSCDGAPARGEASESRRQSGISRGRLNNPLVVINSSTTGERAIPLAGSSGIPLVLLHFCRRI